MNRDDTVVDHWSSASIHEWTSDNTVVGLLVKLVRPSADHWSPLVKSVHGLASARLDRFDELKFDFSTNFACHRPNSQKARAFYMIHSLGRASKRASERTRQVKSRIDKQID